VAWAGGMRSAGQSPVLEEGSVRLWTVHPKYLDSRGFCGLWREALLAQAVLLGRTKGYRNHPQLERFRQHSDPPAAISTYLLGLHAESLEREYDFDLSKIRDAGRAVRIVETKGQLLWEWEHLKGKLSVRAPEVHGSLVCLQEPDPHPMFDVVAGPVRSWERGADLPD